MEVSLDIWMMKLSQRTAGALHSVPLLFTSRMKDGTEYRLSLKLAKVTINYPTLRGSRKANYLKSFKRAKDRDQNSVQGCHQWNFQRHPSQ